MACQRVGSPRWWPATGKAAMKRCGHVRRRRIGSLTGPAQMSRIGSFYCANNSPITGWMPGWQESGEIPSGGRHLAGVEEEGVCHSPTPQTSEELNGCVFTAWHQGSATAFELELLSLGVELKHSRPYHISPRSPANITRRPRQDSNLRHRV